MITFPVNGVEHPAAHWIGPSGAVLAFKIDEDIEFPSIIARRGEWLVFDFAKMDIASDAAFVAQHIQRFPKAAGEESPERFVPAVPTKPRIA